MRFSTRFILIALMAASPSVAAAQDICGELLAAPAIGDWAEYQASHEGEEDLKLRFAIVGSEQRSGTEMLWFEMAITGAEEDQSTIVKVLVPGYPVEVGEVEKVVMKAGGGPAMKMGTMELVAHGGGAQTAITETPQDMFGS